MLKTSDLTHQQDKILFFQSPGECKPNAYPNINFEIIEDLSLTTPQTVNIFMWTVAALSLIWLFSSVTLLSSTFLSNFELLSRPISDSLF